MSEFKIIQTQEEFDAAIQSRLERERSTTEKKFEGYMSPEDVQSKYAGYMSPEDVQSKYAGYMSPEDVGKLQKQLNAYENDSVKRRIAQENGLGSEAAAFLTGSTEEDIKKSAEKLKTFLDKEGEQPLYNPESKPGSKNIDQAYKKLLDGMRGN